MRERERRAREGELVLVVVTGHPSTRAELAGEPYRNHPDTPVVQIDAIGDASRPVANVADEVWGRARGSGDL